MPQIQGTLQAVTPAQAGVQKSRRLDTGLRRYDG